MAGASTVAEMSGAHERAPISNNVAHDFWQKCDEPLRNRVSPTK
jgi:hypothetical protein